MKMTFEQVENGFVVTSEDGKRWIALENEYSSMYNLSLERVLKAAVKPAELISPESEEEHSFDAPAVA